MAKLLFISGPLTGKYVSLDQQKTSFGRSPEADVVVADPEIEEVHFNVLREMAEYFVVDNNSTHGTLLDGARVKRAKIVHRSRIQFGKHVIVFFHDLTPGLSPAGGFDKAVKGTKESGSAEVRFIEGPVAGKRVSISATRTAFGRSKSCDVCLADAEKSISRHHFFVEREADKFYLIDNNSVNGTWLNGQKITRAELSDGDQIRVGPHLIRFALTKTEALPIASVSATEAARPSQETISLSSGSPRTSHVFVVRSLVDAVRSADYAAERLKIGRGPDCDVV